MVQVELGEELESRLADAARECGLSVDGYIRSCVEAKLPRHQRPGTLEQQQQAAKQLSTFARDRNINIEIPEGMSMREYIREACGF